MKKQLLSFFFVVKYFAIVIHIFLLFYVEYKRFVENRIFSWKEFSSYSWYS